MESTPPPSSQRSKTKLSSSRLSKPSQIPQLNIESVAPSSPKNLASTPSPASTVSPKPPYTLPLRELLTLSPSPVKRSKKARFADTEEVAACDVRKKCKNRNASNPSPRVNRRSRRRGFFEQDGSRDELFQDEVLVKAKKKRHGESHRSRAVESISSAPSSVPSPKVESGGGCNLDGIGELIRDLVMWKDVSKSSLWFGFGSLCFLSSCFAKSVSFSIFSLMSQVGLLCLVLSFFSNTIRQRDTNEIQHELTLREEDILKIGRIILPAANLAISKTRVVFSGEPATTLRVVPLLLLGTEYGHLVTFWRLCALIFFISFTIPKLCSVYASQLSKKVEKVKSWTLNSWGACAHKKMVVASAVTGFWNLTSIRTRIIAAFLCLVILRYRNQRVEVAGKEDAADGASSQEMALVAVDLSSSIQKFT